MKIKVTFIGFSEAAIYRLLESRNFELVSVITQNERLDASLRRILYSRSIRVHVVSSQKEAGTISKWIITEHAIMYKFGFILPADVAERNQIFNIHPGNLETNRGAHPLSWTILLGDVSTCLSLYRINKCIDLGFLIATYWVKVLDTDDTLSLELRLDVGLDQIFEELYRYLLGEIDGKMVTKGVYRPKIRPDDFTIDLKKDTYIEISRKIRSQRAYRGAVIQVNGFRFYVKSVEFMKIG
jgi:methionyl-tRNA formyltransferase